MQKRKKKKNIKLKNLIKKEIKNYKKIIDFQ